MKNMWKRIRSRASCLLGDHDWYLVGDICATTGTGTYRCRLCGQYKVVEAASSGRY